MSTSRNLGIEIATGKYLMFIDNDDFVEPSYVETYVSEIEKYSADLIIGGYQRVNSEKILFKDYPRDANWGKYVILSPWAKIYRTELIKNNDIKFLDYPIGEDIYFINPSKSKNNRFKHDNFNFTLSPHGLGQKVPNKNADIKISKDNIIIGNNSFKDGQILDIDVDIKIRGTAPGDEPISKTVQDILNIYPGQIQGKMKQIASITKRGFKVY